MITLCGYKEVSVNRIVPQKHKFKEGKEDRKQSRAPTKTTNNLKTENGKRTDNCPLTTAKDFDATENARTTAR